ncbi:hypothetical protein N7494_012719 [Penicillium frequentans]|uniref:Uncharacterized protein n=1 Tax=Penicillium frequentans TaxID=3151616 RepID=A0AAD6GC21_9EURO|nr:hypothetical protein N7494_012719 [Penicillium glabrum]
MARVLALLALAFGATAYQQPLSFDEAEQLSKLRSAIKNVVVLVQENLSFDHFAGGLTYNSSIDGLVNRKYCNPANVSIPDTSRQVCAANTAQNIAADDPNHSVSGINMQLFGSYHPPALAESSMDGFITEQRVSYRLERLEKQLELDRPGRPAKIQHDETRGMSPELIDLLERERAAEVIDYFTPEHIPVFNAIAENYVLFDRWFAAVPGPTNPNRAYLTSGTSFGHGRNDEAFLRSEMPQISIFQQLSEKGMSWTNYEESTRSNPPFLPDAMFYEWTAKSITSKTSVKPIEEFYQDAANGELSQLTWINPECCHYTSMHPPSPINMGENYIKGIYEALRKSPQWNETLFILTWDEHGGFADHVSPPMQVPAGDSLTYTERAADGGDYTFHFDRLGVRVPTVLISPWVGKGLIQNKPDGDTDFTHTSILKTLSELWDLDILTPRVEWSPSFKHLITSEYRDDTPEWLPEAADF